MRLGKIAVNHIKRFRLIGENEKETYLPVTWIKIAKENRAYIMQLRPRLVESIRELNLFKSDVDVIINKHLQNLDMEQENFNFSYEQRERPKLSVRTIQTFSRSVEAAKKAL